MTERSKDNPLQQPGGDPHIEFHGVPTPKILIVNYLEPEPGVYPRPDYVVVKGRGIGVTTLVNTYEVIMADESVAEEDKISAVSAEHDIAEIEVVAAMSYYERNKSVIDARRIEDAAFFGMAEPAELADALKILDEVEGTVDPLFQSRNTLSEHDEKS